MKHTTMKEMNKQYENYPSQVSEYIINGKKYIVKSHFIGEKNLDEVLYRLAFQQAVKDILATA
jgi:uncharacterized protein YlzI (FlbEa/FlbD family)